MPTYQYRCTECSSELEVVQKFTDPSLTTCPECSGSLRKVFNAVGVVFKGSGFYRTDSRTDGKSGGGAKSDSAPAKETKSESSTSGSKTESSSTKSDSGTSKSDSSPKKSDSGSSSSKVSAGAA
ncbi:FmdB family zinc ribbon protein [Microlunatus speluncae]|uniref:FmdB family zinc ribbon protein n=1 Tax=Microlunatus speluncae TaxID=2594267 RepID=UPI00126649C1|nr:FmdB family zinc ribbon protein [Microlunatus speluncae]